jgi:hypothetical protein
MQRLIEFLMANPWVALIVVAWVAGMIGNIGKAAKKTRERAERARSAPSQPQSRQQSLPAEPGRRSAEEVAKEMRRILGLDPEAETEQPSEPPPPRRVSEEVARRDVVTPERPPTPVMPTTQERKIKVHVDPHVGNRIAGRQSPQSGRVGKKEPGSAIGSLGGRVGGPTHRRRMSQRFSLDNIPKALVLNEILSKPLALRELDDRFV